LSEMTPEAYDISRQALVTNILESELGKKSHYINIYSFFKKDFPLFCKRYFQRSGKYVMDGNI